MDFRITSKKLISSAMAFSLLSGVVVSADSLPQKTLFPTGAITALAASSKTYGNWEYVELTRYTAKVVGYSGNETNVIIPESINNHTVKELGEGLFAENSSIKSVVVPRGVTAIPKETFLRCSSLSSVSLPYGIKTIGKEAFRGLSSLETIYLPNSLQRIDDDAFYFCTKLKTVNMPSCEYVGSGVFSRTGLTSFTFPSNLRYIGNGIFDNTNITSVKLTNRDSRAFSAEEGALTNWNLTNIDVPNAEIFGVLLRDSALKDSRKLTSVNGSSLVQYTSSRFGPYTRPTIKSDYFAQIQKYFDTVDADRIGFYEEYLSADIRYIVMDTTAGCRTDGEKILALHDWVCNKVDFDYLPNGKENHAIYNHVDSSVFMRDKTVCDGYARAMKLLLDQAGIEAYFTASGTHAWTIVKLGDYYFHLDACHDDLSSPMTYDHFLKSDDYISKCGSHKNWVTSMAENANYPQSRISSSYIYGTPTCPYSMGDANRDGKVDKNDAKLIDSILNGRPISKYYDGTLADADLDGQLTSNDVYTINRIVSNS